MNREEIRQAVVSRNKFKLLSIGRTFGKPRLEQPDVTIDETAQQILDALKKDNYPHLGPIILDLAAKL